MFPENKYRSCCASQIILGRSNWLPRLVSQNHFQNVTGWRVAFGIGETIREEIVGAGDHVVQDGVNYDLIRADRVRAQCCRLSCEVGLHEKNHLCCEVAISFVAAVKPQSYFCLINVE